MNDSIGFMQNYGTVPGDLKGCIFVEALIETDRKHEAVYDHAYCVEEDFYALSQLYFENGKDREEYEGLDKTSAKICDLGCQQSFLEICRHGLHQISDLGNGKCHKQQRVMNREPVGPAYNED